MKNLNQINNLIKTALIASTLLTCVLMPAAMADDDKFQNDWLMKIQTEDLRNQFKYAGSTLTKVEKVTVKYSRKFEADQGKTRPYEYLWYHAGKPIGLERLGKLEMTRGESAAIQVVNKGEKGIEQDKAAANAILRMMLDAYHNSNPIISIRVPADCFDSVIGELRKLNCVDATHGADEEDHSKMSLSLQSEPKGMSQQLYFY